eukprot:TRINITY_DN1958_c2_g1_i1.p1 TRINITY_DN1958_c2_g1~~TRINITY_DN1958_c2_g1_i1.p1  ORF type:complete len:270 (+),score=78.39 TRINITY_DN1958_c2_g1_i1:128-937(+)
MSIVVKVGFPPGHSTLHCMIKADSNATVRDTLKGITSKQNIPFPEQYILYIPQPQPKWMADDCLMGSFHLRPQDMIEVKKKHQMVRTALDKTTHTLLVDVTRPLHEFMSWVIVKFMIEEEEVPSLGLYCKGIELNQEKTLVEQCSDNVLLFTVGKRGVGNVPPPPPIKSPPPFRLSDSRSTSLGGDVYPPSGDDGSFSLLVAAKSIVNPQMEGYLRKQSKKDWKKKYFILKDKTLYCFKSSQDRKASSVINLLSYTVQPALLSVYLFGF